MSLTDWTYFYLADKESWYSEVQDYELRNECEFENVFDFFNKSQRYHKLWDMHLSNIFRVIKGGLMMIL